MRGAPTHSEELLWRALRASQLGVAFRRQVPLLGCFVVDFFAPSVRLVVEIDRGYHADRSRADACRERKLVRAGYRVLRLEAESVERALPVAVARLRDVLAEFGQ
jgi:very-short-patch-repair endonuclease